MVDAWVTDQLASRGIGIVAAPVTHRARLWSVVRCFPTDIGWLWFKETNPGHGFEAGLTAAVAAAAPDQVVVPVAIDPRRGWLLTRDHGRILDHDDVADQRMRIAVVGAIARLQCRLHRRVDPAVHAGLPVIAPNTAGQLVRAVAAQWANQPPGHPLWCDRGELERIEAACCVLDQHTAPLADTKLGLDVELNDVYAANICVSGSSRTQRFRFFDFGNAVWGHPFVTLHGFLASVEEWNGEPLGEADRAMLNGVYLARWEAATGIDRAHLVRDLAATSTLVQVHKLLAWLALVPYADDSELRARAAIPRQWMRRLADLAA